jgi:hypothetical protein
MLLTVVAQILRGRSASPLVLVGGRGVAGEGGIVITNFGFFKFIFNLKMLPKNQNMKLQKRYLEVSKSTGKEVRAFFRFTAKRKNI